MIFSGFCHKTSTENGACKTSRKSDDNCVRNQRKTCNVEVEELTLNPFKPKFTM